MTRVPMGLRLALGGDRAARVRLLLMAGGVSVAVALLLAVAGALPAALERLERGHTRTLAPVVEPRTEGVRTQTSRDFWRGQPLERLAVEVVGPPVVPPAGVTRLPGPGEAVISPALAQALQGPHAAELAPRLPASVIGTIGRAGLVGPDELVALVGAAPGVLDHDLASGFQTSGRPQWLTGWTGPDGEPQLATITQGASDELKVAAVVATVGLVVPLLVLVGTATRLSAQSRDRRTAALRLVGATARQLRLLSGVEGALVGAVGVVTGALLFFTLRPPLAALAPVPAGLYPGDVAPPVWAALLVLVGVPLLTASAGLLAGRRALSAPLDVRRSATPPTPSLARLVPLAVGLGLLAAALAFRGAVTSGRWYGLLLLLGGAALCLLGLAVAGPALARAAGSLLARYGPGPASQLAGRRLTMNPSAAARTVTGMALVVAVVGWVLAFLPLLAASSPAGTGDLGKALRPATVLAGFPSGDDARPALESLDRAAGVGPVVPVDLLQLQLPWQTPPAEYEATGEHDGWQPPVQAMVVDCAALSAVLRTPLVDCRTGSTYRLSGSHRFGAEPTEGQYVVLDDDGRHTTEAVVVPRDLPQLTLPRSLREGGIDGFGLYGDLLIAAAAPGYGSPEAVLVGTDGEPGSVETVRAALGSVEAPGAVGSVRTPFPPLTAEEALVVARSATDGYARAATIGLTIVVLVGGLSLAVTTADGLRERRVAHAALAAMGAPVRVLRRSVLLQTATPLLLSVALALAVSAAASWLYLELGESAGVPAPPLPWRGYGLVGVSAIVASLLATAAALPFVSSAIRPEALRTE